MVRRFACSFAFVFVAACGGSVSTGDNTAADTGVTILDGGQDTGAKADTAVADTTVADDTSVTPDDTGTGPADDTGLTSDHEGGVKCGAATCTGTDVCCATPTDASVSLACAASCTGSTIACTSPDNCGQNPCCTNVSATGGGGTPGALCAKAPSECVPSINITARSAQTRLCRNDADCTSGTAASTLKSCCTITYQGNTFKGCFDPKYAGLTMTVGIPATITCP